MNGCGKHGRASIRGDVCMILEMDIDVSSLTIFSVCDFGNRSSSVLQLCLTLLDVVIAISMPARVVQVGHHVTPTNPLGILFIESLASTRRVRTPYPNMYSNISIICLSSIDMYLSHQLFQTQLQHPSRSQGHILQTMQRASQFEKTIQVKKSVYWPVNIRLYQ